MRHAQIDAGENKADTALPLLAAILRDVSDAIILQTLDGQILAWNHSAGEMYGYSEAEALQMNIRDIIPGDLQEEADRFFEHIISSGGIRSAESRRITKTGKVLNVSVNATLLMDNLGNPGGISLAEREITKTKGADEATHELSEIRLKAILAASLDPMVTIDPRGIIQNVSKSIERVFGWKPEEAIGENIKMLMPEPYRSEHDGHLENYRRTGKTNILDQTRELQGIRKNGDIFPCEISISRVELPYGNEEMFTGIIRDITDHKEQEKKLKDSICDLMEARRELEKKLIELESSNKELDDFAYIASHDLKEPLRGLHNYAIFLMEDYAETIDEDGRAKLETITRLTKRLEAFINSLLYYSRLGRQGPVMEKTDLDQVLNDVLDTLDFTLRDNDVDIRRPEPLPTVQCDRVQIGEVLQNLITNAIKYNNKPEKWVEIGYETVKPDTGPDPSATNGDGAAESILISVRDNGIGIRENHIDSIFRIFKRLHGREKFGGGTGAGLTITKKIIERHGGQIWVESTAGEGSTFHFTLPGEP